MVIVWVDGDAMLYPIAAIALLCWLLSRASILPRFDPALMPRLYEKALSILAVLAALVVLIRGNVSLALVLFGISLWLLGRSTRPLGPSRKSGIARVRSKRIEMDLDRATGAMSGQVIEGPDAGLPLDSLDSRRCEQVYEACRQDDPDGARLLETYFDRRFPGWRPAAQADGDARRQQARRSGRMTEEEAHQVLGLGRGATREDIVRAHRSLMKKWHPDQGGTAALATRANEAKDVLLGRP